MEKGRNMSRLKDPYKGRSHPPRYPLKSTLSANPYEVRCFACQKVQETQAGWVPVTNAPGKLICPECHAWIAKG